MSVHLRSRSFVLANLRRRSCTTSRLASTSAPRAARDNGEDDEAEDVTKPQRRQSSVQPEVWLNGEGLQFRAPKSGPNWLGGHVPFPMNPTFDPPTPTPEHIKNEIFTQHARDPNVNNARTLSSKYGISIKRIDAIIRLKQLENQWGKGKQLQTGFHQGMSRMLMRSPHASDRANTNATSADMQADEGQDEARDKYQRSFWEPVAEGEEPFVGTSIARAKDEALAVRSLAKQAKQDPVLMTGSSKPKKDKSIPSKSTFKKEGTTTPEIKFVDVGGKFLDVADRTRRLHEASRRKAMRLKSSS